MTLAWGTYGQAEDLLPRRSFGRPPADRNCRKLCLRTGSRSGSELICHLRCHDSCGLENAQRRDSQDAIDAAQSVLPNNFDSLEGCPDDAEVLLKLDAEGMVNGITGSDQRTQLKQAPEFFTNYARIFPPRPAAALVSRRCTELPGKQLCRFGTRLPI